jgi:hypothetical protein
MFYEPSHEAMIVGLLMHPSIFVLFLESDEPLSFIDSEALIQEGIDEQINVLLLHWQVLLLLVYLVSLS